MGKRDSKPSKTPRKARTGRKAGSDEAGKGGFGWDLSIIDAMFEGVIILDMKGRILSVNPSLAKMTGYTQPELKERDAIDLVSLLVRKEDSQRMTEILTKTFQGEVTPKIVVPIRTKEGKERFVSATASFLNDERGKNIAIIATFRDVTNERYVEEAYKNLVEHSLQGLVIFQGGRIIFANDALSKIYGYTREEIEEFSESAIDRIVHPEERTLLKERLQARLEGKAPPSNYEFRILRKDGSTGWVEVSSNTISHHGAPAIQVTVFDITERKRAEQEIRRKVNQSMVLHRASQEIVQAGYDLEKIYLAIHHATSQLMPAEAFVISLYESKSQEIEAVYLIDKGGRWPAEKVARGEGLSSKVILTGQSILLNDVPEQEIEHVVRFGHPESVRSILAVPMRLGERVIGMIATESYSPNAFGEEDRALLEMLGAHAAAVLQNVRLFEETRQSNLTLEFINDLMSHDLTNINQVTLGYLDFLGDTGLTDIQRKYLDNIKYSARRNARLIENVKKIWKSRESQLKSIDMDACIREAITEVNIYPGKNVRINYDSLPRLVFANELLVDMVSNLLDNAIKFDASLEVVIDIVVSEQDDLYKLSVIDRGKGIPDEYKKTIFSRLERLEKGVRGTGLGLHLVRTIVEGFGGEVWVEDRMENGEPRGSVFNVTIPKSTGIPTPHARQE